jgi:hypothetical protein
VTDTQKLEDYEDARRLLLADGQFRPHASLTEMARSLLIQRDSSRRRGAEWREQVLAAGEADEAQAPDTALLESHARLLEALCHMRMCGRCAEDSWNACDGGRDANDAIAAAEKLAVQR